MARHGGKESMWQITRVKVEKFEKCDHENALKVNRGSKRQYVISG